MFCLQVRYIFPAAHFSARRRVAMFHLQVHVLASITTTVVVKISPGLCQVDVYIPGTKGITLLFLATRSAISLSYYLMSRRQRCQVCRCRAPRRKIYMVYFVYLFDTISQTSREIEVVLGLFFPSQNARVRGSNTYSASSFYL